MKKTILIAALGLFSLNIMAQDAKPEEGFCFHDSERKPDYFYQESKSFEHLLGVSQLSDSLNQNCFA